MSKVVSECLDLREVAKGTYELKLSNYSNYSKSVGSVLNNNFRLLNRAWSLNIYPGGNNTDSKEYISVFLSNEEVNSKVTVRYAFTLVNQRHNYDSKKSASTYDKFSKNSTPQTSRIWGRPNCFKQSLLTDANSPYIVDDTVIFRVDIEMDRDNLNDFQSFNMKSTIRSAWLELFESGLGSDVDLVFNNDEQNIIDRVSAHKCILMVRSPVFKAMFTHNMSESNTNEIVISDFSPEVIREMLHFMYTDKLQSETLDNTVYEGLLGAAIKYDVPDLINLCEEHFCEQLSTGKILQIYEVAERTGSCGLKESIISYIKRNSSELVNIVEFRPLLEKCLTFACSAASEKSTVGKKRKAACDSSVQMTSDQDDSGCVLM